MTTTINNEHKKLNVPNLRFPEFQGEWEEHLLGNISDVTKLAGFEFTKYVSYEDNGNIIAIRGLNCKNGSLDLRDVKYIDNSDFSKLSRSKLYTGDILYTYVGTVGEVAVVDKNDKYYLAPNVSRIRLSKDYNSDFIKQLLGSKKFYNQIVFPLIATSSQPALSMENLRKFKLKVPSIREQTKIASLLNAIDERIATQNKIIEDLKKLKSAIIEKHYCKVEKQIACVGDLGEPFSVGNLAKDDLTETGIPCVIYGELFTTYGETISQIESHTYKTEGIILSKKGDLLFPSSTTVDAMSLIAPSVINMDGVILGGDMFGIHISPNFNAQYLSYYFNHIAKRHLAKFAKGSTIIHLHYADIEKAKLLLPSLEEQNRMAKCLVTLDDKIKKERTFFDLLNSQKAYLLCHMFI